MSEATATVKELRDLLGRKEILRCPKCRHVEELDGYDVLGADPGNLFCNNCGHEAPMDNIIYLVDCPRCGAKRRKGCTTKKGKPKWYCAARETNAVVLFRLQLIGIGL